MAEHFTKFPNYLFEELYQTDMSSGCFRVFLFIYRMTAGYQKTSDRLSLSKIAKETGLSSRTVIRCLSSLQENGFIKISKKKKGGQFYETNTIKLLRGSDKNDTRGSDKIVHNSVTEMSQYPLKGKESPFNDGGFIAPSLNGKKIAFSEEELDDLGDEYE